MPHHHPELVRIWSEYADEPIEFAKRFWPTIELAPYQRAILESVRDNPETWVHSANKMGKSFVAALTAVWWFATRHAKVVTSSTTQTQLGNVLWGEIRHLFRTASVNGKPYSFGFRETHLRVEHGDGEQADKKFYLIGQVTEKVESFQGHHLKREDDGRGTVLFIFEEASGLDVEFYEAASSQAHSMLFIGNPLNTRGVYYETCRLGDQAHPAAPRDSGKLFRKVIHVSGEHSPNVVAALELEKQGRIDEYRPVTPGILSYEEYLVRKSKWPPAKVRSRLLGLFPDESQTKLFPPEWLDLAQALGRKLRDVISRIEGAGMEMDPSEATDDWDAVSSSAGGLLCAGFGHPFALGVDVSQGGGHLSAWCVLGRWGVRYLLAKETPNTCSIADETRRLIKRFRIRDSAVAFDSGGGGKQAADRLREMGHEDVVDIHFGAAPSRNDEYRNKRAELYGELRKALEPNPWVRGLLELEAAQWRGEDLQRCLALPPDDGDLREDLAVLPLLRDSEGRLYLPPKDAGRRRAGEREPSVRELLHGRSPDRGDALALANYALGELYAELRLRTVPDDRRLVY